MASISAPCKVQPLMLCFQSENRLRNSLFSVMFSPTHVPQSCGLWIPRSSGVLSLFLSVCCVPEGSSRKESACKARDPSSVPGSRRSPGEGNGNPLECSRLGNPMDRGAWWAVLGGTKSQTRLSDCHLLLCALPAYSWSLPQPNRWGLCLHFADWETEA